MKITKDMFEAALAVRDRHPAGSPERQLADTVIAHHRPVRRKTRARDLDLYYLFRFMDMDGIPRERIYDHLAEQFNLTRDSVRMTLWRIGQPDSPVPVTEVRRVDCNDLEETATH